LQNLNRKSEDFFQPIMRKIQNQKVIDFEKRKDEIFQARKVENFKIKTRNVKEQK
jgi:hypothetical protein